MKWSKLTVNLVVVLLSVLSVQIESVQVALAQATGEGQGTGVVSLPDPDSPGDTSPSGGAISVGVPAGSAVVGTNVRAAGGPNTGTQAEISMASSGPNIVITFNGGPAGAGFVTSTDGGVTFSANASPPTPAGSNPCCDPAIVADLIGRFYFVQLYRDDGANTPNPGNCTNSLHVSTNGGVTFSNIVGSPFSYPPGTDFPDQPHMGIDRVNLVNGQPQLYVFTRHFTSGINCPQTGGTGNVQGEVVCSTDGGVNWTAPTVLAPFTDLAHWAVGTDGSTYLIGNGTGTAANTTSLLLRRSTADCNTGLAFGAPVVVADNLTFGATGLDREFPQPYVALDRVDPNIAYVSWSSDRLQGDGDRDIFLARCTFAGTAGTCEAPVRINDNTVGDGTAQYFPMLCVDPNNVINLSWNDQRAGANSTAIMHTEVLPTGASLSVGKSYISSEVNFTPANFGGTPDYGDYNENNDACDGQHMYAAWTSHVSPPGIVPASNDPDVFFTVINNLGDVRAGGPLEFTGLCLNSSDMRPLEVYNTGDATLTVNNVSRVAGSTDITVDVNPDLPLKISPDAHVSFNVRCSPTSLGTKTATIRVDTDDPEQPQLDLTATCTVGEPDINISMANSGNFGNACVEEQKDLTLQVLNQGTCNLAISDITSSNLANFTLPNSVQFDLILSPDAAFDIPLRFEPNGAQVCAASPARTADITIESNDPDEPSLVQTVSGTVPCAVASTTGELDFGELCQGEAEKQSVQVCDTGKCNLTVTDAQLVGPDCDDLTLISPHPTPLNPLVISPDFCFEFVVEFEPDDLTAPSCSLQVSTTDPANPLLTFPINASVGSASLLLDPPNLTGPYAFPATVTDPQGDLACFSDRTAVLRNTGSCPAEITNISAAGAPFSVVAPTQFPITLPPGEETLNLTVRFAPATGGGSVTQPDETTGTLTVESNDPAGDLVGNLCGEAVVQSGGRWLVVDGGDVPIASVDRISLQSFGLNTPSPINLAITNVAPQTTTICSNTVRYHLQREDLPPTETTGNSPNSSYRMNAKEGNLQVDRLFTLDKCEFRQDIFKMVIGAPGVSMVNVDASGDYQLVLPHVMR